jgi:hypothetical protein
VEVDPTRMCELLVGLPAVNVLGIDDGRDEVMVVHIESTAAPPPCPGCGRRAWVKDRPTVELVDLPCFGRPARLVCTSTAGVVLMLTVRWGRGRAKIRGSRRRVKR